jgi:hypothetical protein
MRISRPYLAVLLACLGQACSATPVAAAPRHDEPVAPDEPRAELKVQLDLPKTASCEETFDLALYASRGIDLVDWEGPFGKCAGRKATIRYLPKRIPKDELLKTLQKLAKKVEVLP